ncbi:MAG: 2-C-methyl-D-erythritol 2,4-cyclodiphosphate synthase, partial [Betaproteobacteria bacterium]
MIHVGIGYDVHPLVEGRKLILGGVEIPHSKGLDGHSDADALLHAITDALLGAAALGDIGELFPDTDPANKGRDSAEMLRLAADRVAAAGWRVVNLDCVIFAQRPKILPYRQQIRSRVAAILDIDEGNVWLKAKTGEGVGPIGAEEAIAAECVVL